MRMRRTLAYLVFASCVVVFAVKNRAAEVHNGDWTISKSETPGKVEFSLIEHHHGGMSNHQSDWPASSFRVSTSRRREDRMFTSLSRATQARSTAKGSSRTVKARDSSTFSPIQSFRAR